MENNDTELKTLFSQLSRLEASIFYLEHIILESEVDKYDIDVSIKILKKIRNSKQDRLNEIISKN